MTTDLTFPAKIDLQAAKGKGPPRISILAYAGGIMTVPGHGETAIDVSGLELSDSTPLLIDHENSIDSLAGSGTPAIENGQVIIRGTISPSSEAGKKILALHRDNVPLQASVGISILDRGSLKAGESIELNGRMLQAASRTNIVRKGRLREVSLTPIGADPDTIVSIAARDDLEPSTPGGRPMTKLSSDELVQETLATERKRIADIESLTAGYDSPAVTTLKAKAMSGEITIDNLKDGLLSDLRASRQRLPGIHTNGKPVVTTDVLEASLLLKIGNEKLAVDTLGEQVVDAAHRRGHMTFADMCKASLQLEGKDIPGDPNQLIAGGFSTVSLPVALSNVMHKSLLQIYREAPATWRSFCSVRATSDFKQHTSLRPSLDGQLLELGKDGQVKATEPSEQVLTYAVGQYARLINITRVDLRNDDSGFLQEIPRLFGKASIRLVSNLVWRMIMANETNHFSGANGNIVVAPLGVQGLGDALAKMRGTVDGEGVPLDLMPKTMVVAPEQETEAKALLESEFLENLSDGTSISQQPTGNALRQTVTLQVEPRLSNDQFPNYNPDTWYLFASPVDAPWITAFLDGRQAPAIEFQTADFDRLGAGWRCVLDVGTAPGDPKAGLRCDPA